MSSLQGGTVRMKEDFSKIVRRGWRQLFNTLG